MNHAQLEVVWQKFILYISILILHQTKFRHGPTCTQCSLITTNDTTVITEPFTADDIEVAVNELSPRSTQSISRATMSPMINALTNATVAAVIASVEEDTEVPVPRRTTRSQSARLNLAATFEGFVPANNPNAWRDRDRPRVDLHALTLTFTLAQSYPTRSAILFSISIFMLLIFVLTDANEATYSIEFGSNFSL